MFKAAQSPYVDIRACVRVGVDVSEWFQVSVWIEAGLYDASVVVYCIY